MEELERYSMFEGKALIGFIRGNAIALYIFELHFRYCASN